MAQAYPGTSAFALSARTGEGLQEWLDFVTTRSDSGGHLAEVDYDVYAEGEAVLGWLNATIALDGEATQWREFLFSLLTALGRRVDDLGAAVGHVKVIVVTEDKYAMGNLTGRSDTLSISGASDTTSLARLSINARMEMAPETLGNVVRQTLEATCRGRIEATPLAWRCFSPAPPKPTLRYDHVVAT